MWNLERFVVFLLVALTLAASEKVSRQKQVESDRSNSRARSKVRLPRTQVLDDLFNVYDSTFLAHVWPRLRNGMHVSVGDGCWDDMGVFFKQLLEGQPWAYTVVDSSGRYQPGLFEGNRHWLGSKQECLALNKREPERLINGTGTAKTDDFLSVIRKEKYFDGSAEGEWHSLAQHQAAASSPLEEGAPFPLAYHSVSIAMNITKTGLVESYGITLGLCMPRSCSGEDTRAILDFSIMVNDHLRTNRTVPRSVTVIKVRIVEDSYDFRRDKTGLSLILFVLSLLCLTLIATAVDFELLSCKTRNCRTMSFNIEKANGDATLKSEKSNNTIEIHKKRPYEVPKVILPKKEMNVANTGALTINNVTKNTNQINLVTVKKMLKPVAQPPPITTDVIATDDTKHESCHRCGKYRRQCAAARKPENIPCPRMSYNSFASFNSNDNCKKKEFLKSILLCFSLRYSWRKICNTNLTSRDLSAVHALKVVATLWVVFVHVAMLVYHRSADGGDINRYNSTYYILTTGTLGFDTLIFVSGVLSSHHLFFLRRRYSVRELVGVSGSCGRALQCVCFVTNRAIRLVPPYAVALLATAVAARAAERTAAVAAPGRDVTCDRYWWRNLLYVTNFYPPEERCMQISWYLSLESQVHAAATLVLVAAGRRGGAALTAALLVAMATGAADVITAWPSVTLRWTDVAMAYSWLVEREWARVIPYIIGVTAGWLVHKRDGRLRLSRVRLTSFSLWCASLAALAAALALPWLRRRDVTATILAATTHAVWPTALLWPVLAFATKNQEAARMVFDNRLTAALSRLSYGCLLLHGALAQNLLPSGLSTQPALLWSYNVGVVSLTLVTSLALSLLVETPCCSLLRRLSDCAGN